MPIKRRTKESMEEKTDVDVAKEIVVDMEAVKNSIQICLDFEREKNIPLINPKGRQIFVGMYKKYESQNKVRQLVLDTVKDEVKRQITPLDKKLNTMMEMLQKNEPVQEEEKVKQSPKKNKKIDEVADFEPIE